MSDKNPLLLVFAGPNGSGKSTITQYFEILGTYTNADDMVSVMKMSNVEATIYADKLRYASIEKREDFAFETVLSSHYKLDIIRKAKSEGYFIKCFFILTVDPAINVVRVEARVASGGHNVDREKIISRYKKSIDNIKVLLELCDILHVYDNTVEPIRIIRKHKEDVSIFPNELWSAEDILKLMQ